MNRLFTKTAVLAAASALLSACSLGGFTVQDIRLPGGADLGDHPYKVTVELAEVLSLVEQGSVKVNDVPVGRVEKVTLPRGSWHAEVELLLNAKVKLPANATANIEQSSLLGEKYIQLATPPSPSGTLGDGGRIPLERTGRNAETEEVFGALSMLLNGGGLNQLRTINRELNLALNGKEAQIKSTLRKLRDFTGTLDANKATIVAALEGLDRLSSTVLSRTGQVNTVLDDLAPGLKVLERQRTQFVTLLRELNALSPLVQRVVTRSTDDTVADLRALAPTLRKIADSGRDLPKALQVLVTFPFTDRVVGAVKGDYLNVYAQITAADGSECVNAPIGPQAPAADRKKLRLAEVEPLPPGPDGACPQAGQTQVGQRRTGPPLPLPSVTIPSTGSGGGSVLPELGG